MTAVGHDLYRSERVARDVLVLSARLDPGDSGAPVVSQAGRIVGLAFAVARDRAATAYALAVPSLGTTVQAPLRPTGTGPCLS